MFLPNLDKFFTEDHEIMTFLWKRDIIFQELVTHTINHLFAIC